MEYYHYSQVKATDVTDYGSEKTAVRVLINPEIAPNFIMRRFEIQPGGKIGIHDHWNEHEIYIIEGEMDLIDKDGKKIHITKDQFVFVPPDEPHGYLNRSNKPVIFLCVVPKKK